MCLSLSFDKPYYFVNGLSGKWQGLGDIRQMRRMFGYFAVSKD